MVRNAYSQLVVDCVGYTVFNGQPVGPGKTLEAPDRHVPIPRSGPIGVKVIDPIRDAQPAHERLKIYAAGYHEYGAGLAELLQLSS